MWRAVALPRGCAGPSRVLAGDPVCNDGHAPRTRGQALGALRASRSPSATSGCPNARSLALCEFLGTGPAHQLLQRCRQSGRGGRPGVSGRVPRVRRLGPRALDAAMPFDYEHIQGARLAEQGKLKIGLLGFGNFGQFLARRFLQQGHSVIAWNRSDYSEAASRLGVTFFRDVNDFCEDHPDVVVLCSSILSAHQVLQDLPTQRLRRSTLFADVLSVKEFPKTLMLQNLPPGFDILCTHPMFGPESGRGSWEGLPFVYECVRLGGEAERVQRCERFLDIFEREGCRMEEMTCEEHDRYAAGTQFVTHTVGRVLGQLGLKSTPINTKGYETLLNLVENTSGDSFALYYGLFMYNTNATEELQRLETAFDAVKKQLLDQLHSVLREQLLGASPKPGLMATQKKAPLLLGDASSSSPANGSVVERSASKEKGTSLTG